MDLCAYEWSLSFGRGILESDSDLTSQELEGMVCTSQSATIPSIPSVQGRLKWHEKFWLDELEPSSFVAGIISEGYRLPLLRLPDPLCQLNHRSALESASFVTHAINELALG